MGLLIVPYVTLRDQRRLASNRPGRVVTYKERFVGMDAFKEGTPMSVVLTELTCPHLHKTREAAERCKVRKDTLVKAGNNRG